MSFRTGDFDHSALNTVVKNISGVPLTFSFLPPHGKVLADQESYTIFGDIFAALAGNARTGARRRFNALITALDRGMLTIVSSPATVLQDTITGATRIVRLTSGALGVANPSWNTSDSNSADNEAAA